MRRIQEITTELEEIVCDKLCRFPIRKDLNQEELEDICLVCPLRESIEELEKIQDILDRYRCNQEKLHKLVDEMRKAENEPFNEYGFNPYQE